VKKYMKRSFLNALLLLFLGLFLFLGPPARAQNPAVVRLDPAELTLSPGETAGLSLQIEGATGLFGLEIHLAYDPAVVQLLDADTTTPGVQLHSGNILDPEEGFLVANAADNTLGQLDYALTLLAPAEAVSGDGLILTFELRAIANGTSPLDLTVILASADGAALPVIVEDSRVIVAAGQMTRGASPTPPRPSSTPLTTPLSSTATAASAEGGGAGNQATQVPISPAEATSQAATATPTAGAGLSESTSTESDPASATVADGNAVAATIPADQAGSLDPPANPAGELPDGAAAEALASIADQAAAGPSEAGSPADDAGTSQVGWFILGSFLLFAAILFFGRRLLRRYP